MKIAVLGAGAFGRALGGVLAENKYEVDYYDPLLEKPLTRVLDGAERVVLAVPSVAVEEVLPELPQERPLIVATKGILGAGVFAEFSDVMVVSGPAFADDIREHRPVQLTMTDGRVAEMLAADYLSFDQTDDVQGVLLCGALKNVYALLAGYQGLERETPAWKQFITEVAEETQALLAANGGDPATVDLACGMGDLRLTCGLPSRNYEFGQMYKNNPAAVPDKTVEGWTTLQRIRRGEIVIPGEAKKLRWMLEQGWGVKNAEQT